jgi:hypothetical protein
MDIPGNLIRHLLIAVGALASATASAAPVVQFGFGPSQAAFTVTPDTVASGLTASVFTGAPDTIVGKSGQAAVGATNGAVGFAAAGGLDVTRRLEFSLTADATHAATISGVSFTFCPGSCGSGAGGSGTSGTLQVMIGGTLVFSRSVASTETGWSSVNATGLALALAASGSALVSVQFVPTAGAAIGQQWRIDEFALDGAVVVPTTPVKKVPMPPWALGALALCFVAASVVARRRT